MNAEKNQDINLDSISKGIGDVSSLLKLLHERTIELASTGKELLIFHYTEAQFYSEMVNLFAYGIRSIGKESSLGELIATTVISDINAGRLCVTSCRDGIRLDVTESIKCADLKLMLNYIEKKFNDLSIYIEPLDIV